MKERSIILQPLQSSALAEGKEDEAPVCSDLDDECADVANKTLCWLYQPECGRCPFLDGSAKKPRTST